MESMERKKIVVFGSYVADLTGTAEHLPVAGETVFGDTFKIGPGGKGSNQFVASYRAGAKNASFITKLGRDVFGELALDFYRSEGISTEYVLIDDEKQTGIALICVDNNSAQNQILVVPGACTNFSEEDIEKIDPVIRKADILLVQYEVNMDALLSVMKAAKDSGVRILLNPAPARETPEDMFGMVDVILPNESEAEALTGIKVGNEADAGRAADVFHAKGIKDVVITMGTMGAFISSSDKKKLIPARKVDAVDTTGAGDAFNGAFATALSEGKNIFEAAEFANITASLSVQAFGTAPSMPSRDKIDEVIRSL